MADLEVKTEPFAVGAKPVGDWIGQDGYWEILIDGTGIGQSLSLAKPTLETDGNVWSYASVLFVAPASDFEIAFRVTKIRRHFTYVYMYRNKVGSVSNPPAGCLAPF